MRPDSVAFNAALNSAVTAGMLPVAEALLHRAMPAMGVVPTAVSFNILFKGMAMEGSLPHMRLLLHQMKVPTCSRILGDIQGDFRACEGSF